MRQRDSEEINASPRKTRRDTRRTQRYFNYFAPEDLAAFHANMTGALVR
jgi:hypothetical protein